MDTVTVKNISDDLYGLLKKSADLNRRSINSELIYRLEMALKAVEVPVDSRLERFRRIRPKIDPESVGIEEVLYVIEAGRL